MRSFSHDSSVASSGTSASNAYALKSVSEKPVFYTAWTCKAEAEMERSTRMNTKRCDAKKKHYMKLIYILIIHQLHALVAFSHKHKKNEILPLAD